MPDYRTFLVGRYGQFQKAIEFAAPGGDTAIEQAKQYDMVTTSSFGSQAAASFN